VSVKICAAPLTQWKLAYTPAFSEFPKPYLFPILLGVGSGCLLVGALAWTFFRENDREIRVAQQRVSFVNQISHELKTPLTNIRLYTEMAAQRVEESGDMIGKRHLGVVEAEVARLDRLIQNVLNYARQQRDKLAIQPRSISLDHVVGRAVDHWRLLLERKGFELQTRFLGPNEMTADPDAIEQILGNLISNVDKYASYGKWISIQTDQQPEKGVARIIVEDHGPGIPTNKRRTVFEPFERLRSDLNEGVSGTGIGLTISRELADLHGGSLEVCPNYKNGARFILTLPLQPKS
jgi:signal transduction histidine kinase